MFCSLNVLTHPVIDLVAMTAMVVVVVVVMAVVVCFCTLNFCCFLVFFHFVCYNQIASTRLLV